jgi:selenium metabolism protein YedF
MSQTQLDCQGLPCPQPVLRCKNLLSESRPSQLQISLDNDAARQNVTRFLTSQGYRIITDEQHNGQFFLKAEPDQAGEPAAADSEGAQAQSEAAACQLSPDGHDRQLVLVASDVIGHGDDQLGTRLMQNFIATLPEMGQSLWRIIFINAGVRLTIQDSPVLEHLKRLEAAGVSILVCGTCLDHFQLLEDTRVGQTTNMLDVVTSLQLASKVIHI